MSGSKLSSTWEVTAAGALRKAQRLQGLLVADVGGADARQQHRVRGLARTVLPTTCQGLKPLHSRATAATNVSDSLMVVGVTHGMFL